MSKKRNARRRTRNVLLIVSMMLVVAMASIGGTVAWLTDKTQTITNTFTTSDIGITLAETTSDYKMVPGCDIAKDPTVTVSETSEDCWLFVKVEKSANYDTFMNGYAVASGWNQVPGVEGVYYRGVAADADVKTFGVLEGNKVVVRQDVTKQMMNNLTSNPTLSFTAYAVQQEGFPETNIAGAWTQASSATVVSGGSN